MNKQAWQKLIKTLESKSLTPAVIFCFSKKKIDELASQMQNLSFTSAAETSQIHVFCERALERLHGSDKRLPQVGPRCVVR